jgi:hypothetical protein
MATTSSRPSGRLTRRLVFITVAAFLFAVFAFIILLSIWGDGSVPQQQLVDRAWNLVHGGIGSLLTLLATKAGATD